MKKLFYLAKKGEINEKAPILEKLEMEIDAPMEKVWQTLADIGEWPEWCTGITIKKKPDKLETGRYFFWKQNGVKFKSRLAQVRKPHILSWTGSAWWIKAVQVWKLREIEKRKTKVTVEESVQGFLISQFMTEEQLHQGLNLWLNLLKIRVEKDNPQPVVTTGNKNSKSHDDNMLRGIHMLS